MTQWPGQKVETAAPAAQWPGQRGGQPVQQEPAQDPIRAQVQQEIDQQRAAGAPVDYGTMRQILQGMSVGSADEILAGAMTPFEMIKRGTFDPREGYAYSKAREDILLEQQRERGGILGTAAEIAGGAGVGMGIAKAVQSAPAAASAVGRFAQNALGGARAGSGTAARIGSSMSGGAAYGGVTGFNEGSGLEDRLTGARDGAAIGAVAGGAVQGAAEIGRRGLGFVGAAIDPRGYAARQVARGVSESGRSADDITREVQAAARQGQPFTVADAMGNAGQRQLSVVARNPGIGRTQAVEFLDARQAGQGRRLANTLSEGLDAPMSAAQSRAQQEALRSAGADVNYPAARQVATPVNLSGTIQKIDDALGTNPILGETALTNTELGRRIAAIRGQVTNRGQQLVDFDRTLNVKQDLGRQLERMRRAGETVPKPLNDLYRSLDEALEQSSPLYRAANDTFRRQSRAIDALDTGRNMSMRGRTEDTIPAFGRMSPQEQTSARIGYADPIIERMQGGAPGINKAREFTPDGVQDELRAFAAPGRAPSMMDRFARENTMFETRAQATGGSRTADNLADSAAMGVDPAILGNLLSGNFGAAGRNAIVRSADNLGGNTPAVREQLAKILLQTGDDPQLQQTITRAMQSEESMRVLLGSLLRGGMGGTAALSGNVQGQRNR